jgi:hypothetical protein
LVTSHEVGLREQITFLLGRHDPGDIFVGNPDAPPDEYESEAEYIIGSLTATSVTRERIEAVVSEAIRQSFPDVRLSRRTVKRIARDVIRVFESDAVG